MRERQIDQDPFWGVGQKDPIFLWPLTFTNLYRPRLDNGNPEAFTAGYENTALIQTE
jgi:hypothetical protein